jgi:hypothetical protein
MAPLLNDGVRLRLIRLKGLMQTGVVNFDLISNETLFNVILSEFTNEQVDALMKDWNITK